MGEEGMREGRGEEGREGGWKGKRKGGRDCYALWGPSVHALVAHGGSWCMHALVAVGAAAAVPL